jgi:hypothetical protein
MVVVTESESVHRFPQYPITFYGNANIQGNPAPVGSIVTAVIHQGSFDERHFTLEVSEEGKYGSANGIRLKVGGDSEIHGPIVENTLILFYITQEELPKSTPLSIAGSARFTSGEYEYEYPVISLHLDQP